MIYDIIEEMSANNSANYKMDVLKKHQSNTLLQRVLKMTYDKVVYNYYMSLNHWHKNGIVFESVQSSHISFEQGLDFMENTLASRKLTGHAAIDAMNEILKSTTDKDRDVLMKILNRDLRINCGRTQINKVFSGLITKPCYMRCGVFNGKSKKDINFPAIVQLKADGTYREMQVFDGKVELFSRTGEQYFYEFENNFSDLPNGHYTGEMIVEDAENRAISNGMLNSDTPPTDKIIFHVWDYITPDEYKNAITKVKNKIPYFMRLVQLREIVNAKNDRQLRVIETYEVSNVKEALDYVSMWLNAGLEGGVLKDARGLYKDGTSKEQLKLKLEMVIDLRVKGFKEGKIGTKRENTFGAIEFESDDGKIKGFTSGFSDDMLNKINSNRDAYIGKIMAVSCNDITKGRNNEHYALSHPRYDEFRDDKDETDTLERALEIKNMAMEFK
jgi:DNA ligase-1